MIAQPQMKVTSHIGRDLLASAASFKNEAAVVWEYVVNSLQYVDPGIAPRIQVSVLQGRRGIRIADNGSGMTVGDLVHFFQMHGENLERRAGRPGRGKFGTGKSAAFGIANTLRVDTIRNGKRNVVELTRDMINASDGDEIPLKWEQSDAATADPNGTTVSILDINLERVKRASIIEYVERHLQAFRAKSPDVAVDDHVCTYREPIIAETFAFQPTPSQRDTIGDVTLTIKVASAPLPAVDQGVSVTAGLGNLVAIERAGIEAKEFGGYLFGDIDVPLLERPSDIEPYDPSRSLQLNPQHPVVAVLLGFIGSKLEEVRASLVRRSRDARKGEQARRLAAEADKIAEILNDDFRKISERLHDIRAASSRKGAAKSQVSTKAADAEPDDWTRGVATPGNLTKPPQTERKEPNPVPEPSPPKPAPEVQTRGQPHPLGNNAVDPVGGGEGKRRRPQGGFRVEYRQLGPDVERSVYETATLSILINLDHPLVKAALGDGSVEETTFRRLSYEIAFSEYAMGLGYEISQEDPDMPPDDLLYEVRSTLNRISTAAVALYR